MKHVCEILGDNLTDEEIEEMIDDADKDFDGYVRSNSLYTSFLIIIYSAIPPTRDDDHYVCNVNINCQLRTTVTK